MVSKNKKEKGSNKILILGSSLSMKVSQILEPKKQKTPIFSEEKRGLKDFRIIPFPPGNGIGEPKSTAIIPEGGRMSRLAEFPRYPVGFLLHEQDFYPFGFAKSFRMALFDEGRVLVGELEERSITDNPQTGIFSLEMLHKIVKKREKVSLQHIDNFSL